MDIASFQSIIESYQVVFFDAYGVLKNHNGILPGVKDMLTLLKRNNIDFYIVTNDASCSPMMLANYYVDRGIGMIGAGNMVSSAMMSMVFLKENLPEGATVAYLGKTSAEFYIKEANLLPVRIESLQASDYAQLGAIVLFDDAGYEFQSTINKTLNVIRGTDVPVIVANPDLIYPVSDTESAFAVGSIAAMLEAVANRKFFRFGKPDAGVFELAFELANKKRKISKREVLMVGDTLDTDIIGGINFGIDTALVLSGSTLKNQLNRMLEERQIKPTYICNSVAD